MPDRLLRRLKHVHEDEKRGDHHARSSFTGLTVDNDHWLDVLVRVQLVVFERILALLL